MPFRIRYHEEDDTLKITIQHNETEQEDAFLQEQDFLRQEREQEKRERLEQKLAATFRQVNMRMDDAYHALLMEFDEGEPDRAARILVGLDAAAYVLERTCRDERDIVS